MCVITVVGYDTQSGGWMVWHLRYRNRPVVVTPFQLTKYTRKLRNRESSGNTMLVGLLHMPSGWFMSFLIDANIELVVPLNLCHNNTEYSNVSN